MQQRTLNMSMSKHETLNSVHVMINVIYEILKINREIIWEKIIFRVQANHETMESLHVTMNFIYINKNNECYF